MPPLSMTEGMQHIRIMEGVSRSLPSSPLLTHQTISVRLQPMKKLTGKDAAGDRGVTHSAGFEVVVIFFLNQSSGRKPQPIETWAKSGLNLPVAVLPHRLGVLTQPPLALHCTTVGSLITKSCILS